MRSFEMAQAFRFTSRLLVVFTLLVFSAMAVMAQATTGSLRGTVMDASGAFVAGASVTANNEATGIESKTTSSGEGAFELSNLLPGKYSVTVEAPNFKRYVTTGVVVRVGITNPYDAKLEAGNVAETVTVTASTEEVVQREQAQISTTFEARRVTDLPSNGAGAGLDTLALLVPGVVANRSGGTNTNGTGLSVNGNRGRSNNFQIDGADNNDLSVAGPALFVDFADSVQEFQVITSNFSAQYGRNQGAIVNIVTKGGTNQFHGTGFWLHQDAKNLNSLDNIEKISGFDHPDPSLYNVFGGTVGGPVWLPTFGEGGKSIAKAKDRAFFFFAYQGIRNPAVGTQQSANLAILPTELTRLTSSFPGNNLLANYAKYSPFAIAFNNPASINFATNTTPVTGRAFNLGTLAAGCPRSITAGAAVPAGCGVYTAYINPTTGSPFLAGGPYDVINLGTAAAPQLFQMAQYQRTAPIDYTENYYSFRFDVKARDRDNLTFRFLNQKSVNQNALAAVGAGFNGAVPGGSRNLGGNWTRQIGNTMVNELRASYQRISVEFGGGCDISIPGCIPGPTQIGESIANVGFGALGLTKTNVVTGFGPAANLPQGRVGKVYQLADNLTIAKGRHSMILGAEFKKLTNLSPFLPNYNGVYVYNSTARIANNAPSAVAITLGDPLLTFEERDQYYFIQDDFKFRPNLTLNLGLRYEYTGQPINQLNEQAVARESNASTAFFNTSLPLNQRTPPKIKADKNNFAPRVGFAWSPNFWKGLLGEDATVIRGGFSIAYDAAFYNILSNVQNGAPFSAALNLPVGSLPATGSLAGLPADARGDNIRAAALAGNLLPRGLNPRYLAIQQVAPDFHAPYSEQWSLGVQHQFGKNQVGEVRYVGTHGVGLFQTVDENFFTKPLVEGIPNWFGTGVNMPSFANLLPPGTTFQTCTDVFGTADNEGACNQREKPFGIILERANTSQSIYHSMQSRYNGRFFKNALSLGASYTWSKTIDDSSEIAAFANGDALSVRAQNPFCINRCERGLSALDRPHVFTANFIYDVPFMKEQRGVVGHLLGGWQFNGTYILTSGGTWTPGQSFNALLGLGNTYLTNGDRPFIGNSKVDPRLVGMSQVDAAVLFGAPLTNINGFYSLNQLNQGNVVSVDPTDVHFIFNGPGAARIFGTPFGDSGRNTLRGPANNQMNMSVFKNIKVLENLTVQLRGEAFNVLNHPNPGFGVERGLYLPNKDVGNAGNEGIGFAENGDINLARRVVQVGLRIIF